MSKMESFDTSIGIESNQIDKNVSVQKCLFAEKKNKHTYIYRFRSIRGLTTAAWNVLIVSKILVLGLLKEIISTTYDFSENCSSPSTKLLSKRR